VQAVRKAALNLLKLRFDGSIQIAVRRFEHDVAALH
jgi:hypothetical protein